MPLDITLTWLGKKQWADGLTHRCYITFKPASPAVNLRIVVHASVFVLRWLPGDLHDLLSFPALTCSLYLLSFTSSACSTAKPVLHFCSCKEQSKAVTQRNPLLVASCKHFIVCAVILLIRVVLHSWSYLPVKSFLHTQLLGHSISLAHHFCLLQFFPHHWSRNPWRVPSRSQVLALLS